MRTAAVLLAGRISGLPLLFGQVAPHGGCISKVRPGAALSGRAAVSGTRALTFGLAKVGPHGDDLTALAASGLGTSFQRVMSFPSSPGRTKSLPLVASTTTRAFIISQPSR